jgi:cold shock protein
MRPAAAKPAASPRTRTSASTPGPAATEPAAVAGTAITTPATVAPPAAGAQAADRAEIASPRRRGTVKWFDAGKGYGFIRGDDGQDVFVHHSAVSEAGFRAFNQGQTVEYEVRHSPKGLQAVALRSG